MLEKNIAAPMIQASALSSIGLLNRKARYLAVLLAAWHRPMARVDWDRQVFVAGSVAYV